MDDETKGRIEEIIGSVSWAERNIVTDLNSISAAHLNNVRRLPQLLRIPYLWFIVDPASHPYLPQFIEEVVTGGASADTWGRGGIIVPSYSISEILQRPINELLAPLGHWLGENWRQLPPDRRLWDAAGAPALLRADLHYDWTPPEGVMRIQPDAVKLTAVDNIVLAARRWIATQFAMVAGKLFDRTTDLNTLLAQAVPEVQTITEDARIALAALIAEQSTQPSSDDNLGGFRGPDSWYEGSLPAS